MKNKRYFLLIPICIIFFILGLSAQFIKNDNADYDENYTQITSYKNIDIYIKENYINDTNYELYMNDLITIPESLLKNCDKIIFTNENLNQKFSDYVEDIDKKIVAISYGKDIYIYTGYFEKDVLIHEMYHVFDYANDWISNTQEFTQLYEMYGNDYEVSPGNVENQYEFFATYGEKFTLQNDTLERTDLYVFFSNLNIQP